MKKVVILSHNSRIADFTVYPLRKNRRWLRERGYHVKVVYNPDPQVVEADILCLSSVCIRKWWSRPERVFRFVEQLKRHCNRFVYFDEFDSTGVTHFEILPHVDRYLKKQLLKDRGLYTRSFYGDRIFTDFYHRRFAVSDDTPGHQSKPLDPALAHKVGLLWHIGLGDMAGDILPPWVKRIRRHLPPSYPAAFTSPETDRPIDFMFRGNHAGYRNTARFHREKMLELLSGIPGLHAAMQGRVSISQYKQEMRSAKLVVSPFGWGEIGVRDFEAWLYGAALLKPNMSHLETWPDLFIAGTTYYPIKWDFSNLESGIRELVENREMRTRLAADGQAAYRASVSAEGMERFCDRFVQLMEQ